MDEVWSEHDTNPGHVADALRRIVTEHHRSEHPLVPARVLNLVVVVDAEHRAAVEDRLERVGRYHPSRLVLCAVAEGRTAIDAWAAVGSQDGGVARERIELDVGARHLAKLDRIVDPLLVPDLATMVWSPDGHGEAVDALRHLAQIVLVDSQTAPDVGAALGRAAELAEYAYVVDLAWLRSTPWRERVAAAFDSEPMRAALRRVESVTVRHRGDSLSAAVLFCGWLASRLGWQPGTLAGADGGLAGSAAAAGTDVRLALEPVQQDAPGLAGVTIATVGGDAVSLDRTPGGLRSARRTPDGREQAWTVLGASRGESGILGEGVRQALLRDPTYAPALASARAMVA